MELNFTMAQLEAASNRGGIRLNIGIKRSDGSPDPIFHINLQKEEDGSLYIEAFEWANDDMSIANTYPDYFPSTETDTNAQGA